VRSVLLLHSLSRKRNKCLTRCITAAISASTRRRICGWLAEYVYVDLEMLPGTKIYKLPDDMPLRLGALSSL